MPSELFDRRCKIVIDKIQINDGSALGGHDVKFHVEKSYKPEPNTCDLTVYNLSEDQRASLEELKPNLLKTGAKLTKGKKAPKGSAKGIPCKIEAGYGDDLSLIWLGDLASVDSVREGPDWVTTASSGDGRKAFANARMHVAYGPKTPVETALRAMVRALGVGEGNVAKIVQKLSQGDAGKLLVRGGVFSGQVSKILGDFARSADLEWSVQDGVMQFIDRGKALDGKAIKLTPETGMIGSPSVDSNGILSVKMLMIPDVRPGRLLVIKSSRIEGNYKILQAIWEGDTSGGEWSIDVKATRY